MLRINTSNGKVSSIVFATADMVADLKRDKPDVVQVDTTFGTNTAKYKTMSIVYPCPRTGLLQFYHFFSFLTISCVRVHSGCLCCFGTGLHSTIINHQTSRCHLHHRLHEQELVELRGDVVSVPSSKFTPKVYIYHKSGGTILRLLEVGDESIHREHAFH